VAVSRTESHRRGRGWLAIGLLACAPLCAGAAAQPATTSASAGEFHIEADGLELDQKKGTLRMPNVVIRQDAPQGALLIRAREATAQGTRPSFEDSVWNFSGDVHIEYADGRLDADTAQLTFSRNRLQHAQVDGAPAQFSHQLKGSAGRNRGSAKRIEMDVPRGQVRLSGNAWYTDGRNEVTTAAIVYNLRDQSWETERGASQDNRVRMTIRPEATKKAEEAKKAGDANKDAAGTP
jgi:lipopolysaccharide transport protein LptA